MGIVWALRIIWAITPLALWKLLEPALDGISNGGVELTLLLGMLVLWGVALGASMYRYRLTLTFLRIIVPLGLVACIWATISVSSGGNAGNISNLSIVVGFAQSILAVFIVLSTPIGGSFVAAESYGNEARFLLKPPTLIKFILAPMVWAVSMAGVVAGPLLLADTRWILGGIILFFGLVAFALGGRSLNTLVNRMLVFVPKGLVIADPLKMEFPLRADTGQIQTIERETGLARRKRAMPDNVSDTTLDLAIATVGDTLKITAEPSIQTYLYKGGERRVGVIWVTPSQINIVEEMMRESFPRMSVI